MFVGCQKYTSLESEKEKRKMTKIFLQTPGDWKIPISRKGSKQPDPENSNKMNAPHPQRYTLVTESEQRFICGKRQTSL